MATPTVLLPTSSPMIRMRFSTLTRRPGGGTARPLRGRAPMHEWRPELVTSATCLAQRLAFELQTVLSGSRQNRAAGGWVGGGGGERDLSAGGTFFVFAPCI